MVRFCLAFASCAWFWRGGDPSWVGNWLGTSAGELARGWRGGGAVVGGGGGPWAWPSGRGKGTPAEGACPIGFTSKV